MAQLTPFKKLGSLALPTRRRHEVWVRVLDDDFLEVTRWNYQRVVQNAGTFRANKGFNDANARRHRWHKFKVPDRLVARFARQSEPFVFQGLVQVEIDGRALRVVKRRAA